jgi:hypothetical protein
MSEERGAELFRALHAIIDAVTNLNLRDLEAEAKAAVASEKVQAECLHPKGPAHLRVHLQKEKLRILILIGQRFRIIPFLSLHCLLDLDFLRL